MTWKRRFGRKPKGPSEAVLAEVLGRLDQYQGQSPYGKQEAGVRSNRAAVRRSAGSKDKTAAKAEVPVDADVLDRLVGIIRVAKVASYAFLVAVQETMHGHHDTSDDRWPRKLQWPSQKYLRASWIYIWEYLQPEAAFYAAGEAKIPSANAGHIACLGPCLLQAPTPVHTLIVHGEMEYCTLLGHRLHIDLAVYFAALRTLAHFLRGNMHVRELVFAFTGCPMVVTDKCQEPVSDCLASQVLPAFEKVLEENETLRYVSFRVSHKPTQQVNLRRMCATSFEANSRRRLAVVCGLHPRAKGTSCIVKDLPRDVLVRILDEAFPLIGLSRVDFEYCHLSSSHNRSRFAFLRLGRRQEAHASSS